ncbi:hypothetical protein A3C86_01285 [Candidatus Kaiserbacteria bacterium RIFCSPHIGHO2_02_FULL_49_16]|uniref:Uncharacterized protein n=1 Tax=Candidatus Kaiserbacteria bacterium RIFCSPHIGHO2_02_FULL_49_16 TaxID=1798490 RepID=A0A1F6DCE2_9BACT|nr:MAG: hypothetical protein A3C86_01285 [Candidatus Kaiserbacteria bacterium RIFCSPHIGHO2_02_FULL_49_16]
MKFPQLTNLFQRRKERLYTPPERGQEDIFPFEAIDMRQIPLNVQELLESKRKHESRFSFSAVHPWEESLKVEQPGITSYIATHSLDYAKSRMSHFVDFISGKIAGESTIVHSEMLQGKHTPYPEWTATTESSDFQRRGLAERRLALMHAYCKRAYGASLYSSPDVRYEARKLWQKLQRDGRAKTADSLDRKGRKRFQFLK